MRTTRTGWQGVRSSPLRGLTSACPRSLSFVVQGIAGGLGGLHLAFSRAVPPFLFALFSLFVFALVDWMSQPAVTPGRVFAPPPPFLGSPFFRGCIVSFSFKPR